MTVRRSPFSVLGLRPGASRRAVDEAYRRLMKQHHPDLPGGDPDLAAEVNRAYALLKARLPEDQPLPPALPAVVPPRQAGPARVGARGVLAGLVMMALAGALALWLSRGGEAERGAPEAMQRGTATTDARPALPDTFDLSAGPDTDAIAEAVGQALRLRSTGLSEDASAVSRSCAADMAAYPSPALLDHCVAFDAASGLLGGRHRDVRFQPAPMAARHLEAAMRVSNDPVLAEERITRVRQLVERMLVQNSAPEQSAEATGSVPEGDEPPLP